MNKNFDTNKLNPFTRIRLNKEDDKIQRLVWILEMKRSTLQGQTKEFFNKARNKHIKLMIKEGINYEEIYNKAELYEVLNELVS